MYVIKERKNTKFTFLKFNILNNLLKNILTMFNVHVSNYIKFIYQLSIKFFARVRKRERERVRVGKKERGEALGNLGIA